MNDSARQPAQPDPPTPSAPDAPRNSKRGKALWLLLTVLILGLVAGGGFYAQLAKNKAEVQAGEQIKALGGLTTMSANRKYVATLNTITIKEQKTFDEILELTCDLSHLQILDLSQSPITKTQLAGLSGLTNLTTFQLNGTETADEDLRNFYGMRKLESIYLADTNITNAALVSVAKLKSLTILDISGNELTDLQPLAQLPKLTWLLIRQDRPFSDEDVELLSSMSSLLRLTINEAQLSGEQTAQLKRGNPNLSIN